MRKTIQYIGCYVALLNLVVVAHTTYPPSNFDLTAIPNSCISRFKSIQDEHIKYSIYDKYHKKKYSRVGGYVSFVLLPGLGHHLYFGEIGDFLLHIMCLFSFFVPVVNFFCLILIPIGMIWWLVALFRMGTYVNNANQSLFDKLLKTHGY